MRLKSSIGGVVNAGLGAQKDLSLCWACLSVTPALGVAETGRGEVLVHPQLHSKLGTSLGYRKLCHRTKAELVTPLNSSVVGGLCTHVLDYE